MDDRNEKKGGDTPAPDKETLHKTDPQENMKGPVSSMIKGTGEAFETDETQSEADEERDSKL